MIEKIGTIRNPLTIIAIFATLAEVAGTVVLPFFSQANQGIYVWFLMIFPLLLVILFFLTLNFNHKVLYAPSDFKDEKNFFKSLQPASPLEREEKLRMQGREIDAEVMKEQKQNIETRETTPIISIPTISQPDIRARYSRAEELILNKIAKEMKQPIQRDMRFTTPGRNFIFDGVVITNEKITAIEVKYFRDAKSIPNRFKEVFNGILESVEQLPDSQKSHLSLVLAVATDAPAEDHEQLSKRLYSLINVTPFPVEVRIFSLEELERELNIAA